MENFAVQRLKDGRSVRGNSLQPRLAVGKNRRRFTAETLRTQRNKTEESAESSLFYSFTPVRP
jgi:hypothetical protein